VLIAAIGDQGYIRGRLKFNGVKNSAPFPSVVVIYRPLAKLKISPQTLSQVAPHASFIRDRAP
jgi:hypothetical protein